MAWMSRAMVCLAVALMIGLVVSFAWGRLRPPTEAQARAMALLKPVPARAGAFNAWGTFWLLDYDVPAAQVDVVYTQEREHLEAWAQRAPTGELPQESYVSLVAENFPKWAEVSAAEQKLLCHPTDSDCLGKVRTNLHSLRELLSSQAGRLAQLRAIPLDAVLWDDTPHTADTPTPSLFTAVNLRLTAAALEFADGRQVLALAQTCRDALIGRQLHAHTNTFVGAMVTINWMDSSERLLAGMLSELPADQPIPPDCTTAFEPAVSADVDDVCVSVQREYQGFQDLLATMVPPKAEPWRRFKSLVLTDLEHSRRLTAPTYAWVCEPKVIDSMLDDRPVTLAQTQSPRHDFFDVVSNLRGVVLAEAPMPNYTQYLNRNEDYVAGLRLTGWLLSNRATARSPDAWRQRWETARTALRARGNRDFQLDIAGNYLTMPYFQTRPHHHALILPLRK